MEKPINVREAVERYSGWDINQAIIDGDTEDEIRAYFTLENFKFMFGGESEFEENLGYTFEEMADAAIEMLNEEK